jgi:predicted helicase
VRRFDEFYALCRQAINPNLSVEAVEKMLVQHLLTERIFRKVFDNPDFVRRNVIAGEIEKVIDAMTAREFSRDAFLRDLDRFYKAIEDSAQATEDYSEKQTFLNTVYERFFQGYSPKEADTHGIVYTPQPIVDFMVRSVEDILQKEFGRSLSDREVHILDPFVGTGNFIVRIMREIKKSALPYKYEHELHCNEVMLLPYYVASMNIEHAYLEATGEYKAFPGICLVDTFDIKRQAATFTEQNAARIERQKHLPIFAVLGNPPYNAWQVNENDNNRNRRYEELDKRIAETYSKSSSATNKSALSDPYVKAIRWASDRVGEEGIVAFVTNNNFVEAIAADGIRKHLARDFDAIYVLDLGGNVRKNPKLSGTTHNVFGIQVGVSISLLVRKRMARERRVCQVHYAKTGTGWTKEQKYQYLDRVGDLQGLTWTSLLPDAEGRWMTQGDVSEFADFSPVVSSGSGSGICLLSSYGVQTNKDAWVYNFDRLSLSRNVQKLINVYNQQVDA